MRLGLLAGALSTESVSERQGERARALGVGKQTAPKPSWKESEDRERAGSHALKQACPFLHQDFISKYSVFHHPPPRPPHITASRFQPWPGDAWWCVALSPLPVRLSEPERVLGEKMSSVCLF